MDDFENAALDELYRFLTQRSRPKFALHLSLDGWIPHRSGDKWLYESPYSSGRLTMKQAANDIASTVKCVPPPQAHHSIIQVHKYYEALKPGVEVECYYAAENPGDAPEW